MPLFEYKCYKCQDVAEVLQKADAPAPHCASCAIDEGVAREMVKQVSRSSFVLKGGGWASTGYA